MLSHPLQILRGTRVEIIQSTAAADRRADLVSGYSIETALAEPSKKCGVVDGAASERHRADPIGRLWLIVHQRGAIAITRNPDVISVCCNDRMGRCFPGGVIKIFSTQGG